MPSGGARKGAGRKAFSSDERLKRSIVKAFKLKGKEVGKDVGALLADLAYDSKMPQHQLKALDIFMAVVIPKKSQVEVEDKTRRPTIYLPEIEEKTEAIKKFEAEWEEKSKEIVVQ